MEVFLFVFLGIILLVSLAAVTGIVVLGYSALKMLDRASTDTPMTFPLFNNTKEKPEDIDRYTPDYADQTVPLDQFTPNFSKKVKAVFAEDKPNSKTKLESKQVDGNDVLEEVPDING